MCVKDGKDIIFAYCCFICRRYLYINFNRILVYLSSCSCVSIGMVPLKQGLELGDQEAVHKEMY